MNHNDDHHPETEEPMTTTTAAPTGAQQLAEPKLPAELQKPADSPPSTTIAETYGVTDAEYAILRSTVCKEAPRAMAAFFMVYCKRRNLDPFAKQVYLMNVGKEDKPDWQVVTGIDGFRAIAARNPAYRGIDEPEWEYLEDERGEPATFTKDESKYGEIEGKLRVDRCRVRVRRTPPGAPWDCPRDLWIDIVGVIRFDEFVRRGYGGKIQGAWEKAPENQSSIRAEAQAWRKAFPEDVGGMLTFEEAEDIRARNAGEAESRNTAETLLSQAAPAEGADPAPEDAEIEDLARKLAWNTRAMLGSQLARFGGDKGQLLTHMRATWEKQQDSARHRARHGEDRAPEPRQPEHFETPPNALDVEYTEQSLREHPEPPARNPAYDVPGSIEPGTRKGLFKAMNEARSPKFPSGIRDKDDRLAFARGNGVQIDSYTKISENQARTLIDALRAWEAQGRVGDPLAQPEAEEPPRVQKLRCDACTARHGEPHAEGCPIDETDEPEVTP